MKKIQVLDDLTIQKIAAGEVIERPASIVKELVENSLDAGAQNIIIEIKKGGKKYIRVTDDGHGIRSDEIQLAFMKHSTSKLTEIEDIYKIKSLGFRGEALSSISTVAKVEILTKSENSDAGTQANIEEGQVLDKNIVGTPKGTTLIVRDLFYNLPVRKNFLQSDLIETNKISDIVYKIALGNPHCSFKYIKDGDIVLTTLKDKNYKNHIYSILGKEFAKNMVEISYSNNDFRVRGYIGNNKIYRGNRSHQYFYVNGRYIKNKDLSHNIENQYKSIIPITRFPVYILFLEIDPGKIDVNIHPTKQEIKFTNQDEIFNIINTAIKEKLSEEISIPNLSINRKSKEKQKYEELPLLFEKKDNNKDSDISIKDLRNKKLDIEDDIFLKDSNIKLYSKEEMKSFTEDNPFTEDNQIKVIKKDKFIDFSKDDKDNNDLATDNKKKEEIKDTLENLKPIGIIFNTYILAENRINEKFYIIDQHSAHERVMYENYLNEFKNESIHMQQLLAPIILDLTDYEFNIYMGNIDLFKNLGFEIETFGSNSIIIRAVPLVFGSPDISNLFMDIIDNINKNPTSNYDLQIEKIMKVACVNSIKSGDILNEKEVMALFNQLQNCNNPFTCPHGRPTMLVMSKRDIEKEFLRIM